VVYDDDQATTTDLASVAAQTIHDWARTPHPTVAGPMLLPKYGKLGRAQTYLVVNVREAAHLAASTKLPRRTRQDREEARAA
jgi:hypothetical protein